LAKGTNLLATTQATGFLLEAAFRAALGGFLVGCIELGMKRTGNEWFFKMAGGKSKQIELTEESRRNRDICRR